MKNLKYFVLILCIFFFPFSVFAVNITDKLSISGSVTTLYQWLRMSNGYVDEEREDRTKDRGSAVIDFNISFRPTESNEFFLRASFAKGSGFHSESSLYPFKLNSYADDLFVDLKNINAHGRDHLQELWYSHRFEIKEKIFIKFTGGIIDPTAFIDDNVFAADELGQFMNEALVHNPLANLVSYDVGVAGEFEWDRFHFRLVGMRSKVEDSDGRNYNWVGAQVGYKVVTELGEGNYRLYGYRTNKRFDNWDGDSYEALKGIGVSFDQQLIKEALGAFFRAGLQDSSAVVDYNRMVSFGININGSVWGRKDDEIGVGYAYLRSPSRNEELKSSQVFEGYFKFKLFSLKTITSDITFDYQYIRDRVRESENNKSGYVYGVRWNLHF